ncbi:MAG: HEAT repeat domain-containing protein [Planctomycetales bacterium]
MCESTNSVAGRRRGGGTWRRWWLAPLMMLGWALGATASGEIVSDFAMDSDPQVEIPDPVWTFPPRSRVLWIEALGRPEKDVQRQAAETIAQAHGYNVPGLIDAAPDLARVLVAEETHPAARFACARALVVLDARDWAQALLEGSQAHGSDLRQLVEPVLGRWRFEPIIPLWRKRLAETTGHRDLLLAISGLAEVQDAASVEPLLAMSRDRTHSRATRLAAARAVGHILSEGQESEVGRWLEPDSPPLFNRLCAVGLLQRHSSQEAQTILLRLADDPEPTVAAAALVALNAIDYELVTPRAVQTMLNPDANIREQGLIAYLERMTPQRAQAAAERLDDPHPRLRIRAREALYALCATPELDGPIREAAMQVLAGAGWRGQEQAALLLGALEHKPAAGRLVELLESTRPEVMVASAWGLRKVAVPDVLPQILDKAARQTEWRKNNAPGPELDAQVAHLFETLGRMRYQPADALMRTYVPKEMTMGEYSRSAAIYGLGYLRAGTADERLGAQLVERLTESPAAMPPEFTRVRMACGISLARMKLKSQVQPLRDFMGIMGTQQGKAAIRWAIMELTGETLLPIEPLTQSRSGWFLEPLD